MYVGNMQNTVESRRTRNIFYPGTPQILNELTQFLTCPVRYESRSQVEIRAQRPVELGLDSGTTKFNKIRKQSLVKSKQPKVPSASVPSKTRVASADLRVAPATAEPEFYRSRFDGKYEVHRSPR